MGGGLWCPLTTPESEDNDDHDLELEEDASRVQISEQKNAKCLKNLHNYFKKYKTIMSSDEALDPSTISSPSLTTSEGKKNGESDGSPAPDLSKNSFKNIGEHLSSIFHTFDECPPSHFQ